MTRPLSGLSKSSHIYRAALNMNTLGELFAGKLFLSDDFDDELFIHYLMNFVMLNQSCYCTEKSSC